jgi:hypothetical protein
MPFYVYIVPEGGYAVLDAAAEPAASDSDGASAPELVAVVGTRAMADLIELELELSGTPRATLDPQPSLPENRADAGLQPTADRTD